MNTRRNQINAAAALVLAAILAGPAVANPGPDVTFVDVPNTFTNETLEDSKLFIPAGTGPFPAVIVMHGSGGLWQNNNVNGGVMSGHFEEWGTRLQMNGYVALFIDSYTARGVVEFVEKRPAQDPSKDDAVCSNRLVRPSDAYSALEYLRDLDYVIDNRVGIMGFSQGGESTLASVVDESLINAKTWEKRRLNWDNTKTLVPEDAPYTVPANQGFRTAVAYYPGCGFYAYFGAESGTGANMYMPYCPTYVIHGNEDGLYSGNLYPEKLKAKSAAHATLLNRPDTTYPWDDGQGGNETGINPLYHKLYNGVGHSFDELQANHPDYNTKLEAIDSVMIWLDFYLKPQGPAPADWLDNDTILGPNPGGGDEDTTLVIDGYATEEGQVYTTLEIGQIDTTGSKPTRARITRR